MPDRHRIVQNPVLKLLTLPDTEGITGRGKSDARITPARFIERQKLISRRLNEIQSSEEILQASHGARVLLWVGLDPDSQAPSHTPHDLFSHLTSATMLFAWRNGYVVEFSPRTFEGVQHAVSAPDTPGKRCDIFSIDQIELFATVLHEPDKLAAAWDVATEMPDGSRLFNLHLARFEEAEARRSVTVTIGRLINNGALKLGQGSERSPAARDTLSNEDLQLVERQMRQTSAESRAWGFAANLRDRDALKELVLSGSIARWEPITSLRPTVPGDGPEPDLALSGIDDSPIVGVIDGGYHGTRYEPAVAWRFDPPLIPNSMAAAQHGNQVASLVVDAHLWSNQLNIPHLNCRLGVVQAVPRVGIGAILLDQQILNHVEAAFSAHPETHVWNLSANLGRECDEFEVSDLGHGLTSLCRRHNKLLVVSAGNRDDESCKVAPPADCESAIVVGGRLHDRDGRVADACGVSRVGLGPEGMLKPEASWFSEHRVVGGGVARGTSFAAPLVSRLAAHTWENLNEPNPDLVKALLISACDLSAYRNDLGFGSPVNPELPWICPPNASTLAWSVKMSAQQRYYWTGIRIPPSLMKNGRFVGRAKLVGILSPHIAGEGHHYFQNRLETNLAYTVRNPDGTYRSVPLVGCINPKQFELDARREDNKWDPVRVYSGDFTGRKGMNIPGDQPSLHVYARLYWRDTFAYSEEFRKELESQVSFVVVLESDDPDADTYNEFRRIMAENVESAIVEQELEIDDDFSGLE